MPNPESPDLDALADAIAQRLGARFPGGLRPIGIPTPGVPGSGGPYGEIDPERPPFPPDAYTSGTVGNLPRTSLAIAGMELTQSIQYSGAAGVTYGNDNAIPLVALKTLVARVYPVVHTGFFSDTLTGSRVTGELMVSYGDRVAYRTGPTRAPAPGSGRSDRSIALCGTRNSPASSPVPRWARSRCTISIPRSTSSCPPITAAAAAPPSRCASSARKTAPRRAITRPLPRS
jgi:hypothetical protein